MLKIYDKHRRSIPAGIPSPKVSLFENMTSVVPIEEISLWEFLLSSDYQDIVHIYRETQDPAVRKEIKKFRLPLCDRFRNIRYTSPKKGSCIGIAVTSV